ncbi:hypothetical protein ACFQZC_24485 [Streptacidiphilus monticola]
MLTSTLVLSAHRTGGQGDPRKLLGEFVERMAGDDWEGEVDIADVNGRWILFREAVLDLPAPQLPGAPEQPEDATAPVALIEALVPNDDGSVLAAIELATPSSPTPASSAPWSPPSRSTSPSRSPPHRPRPAASPRHSAERIGAWSKKSGNGPRCSGAARSSRPGCGPSGSRRPSCCWAGSPGRSTRTSAASGAGTPSSGPSGASGSRPHRACCCSTPRRDGDWANCGTSNRRPGSVSTAPAAASRSPATRASSRWSR